MAGKAVPSERLAAEEEQKPSHNLTDEVLLRPRRLTREGLADAAEWVTITAGMTTTIDAALTPYTRTGFITGTIQIS